MSPTLPPFVADGNFAIYDGLGAAQLDNVVMHSFCIAADQAKIQAWLDKTFAQPSAGAVRYRAVGDRMFLGVAELGRVYTIGDTQHGYTTEIDVTFWLLAERVGTPIPSLRWIPAYLFVDSGPVLVIGREVWGFPKQIARFAFTPQGSDPAAARTFAVDGWAVERYGPESHPQWRPMIEARPKSPVRQEGVLGSLEALARTAVDRLGDGLMGWAGHLNTALGAGSMTMAFLKEFPDAAQPTRACYQAIIEAVARVTRFGGAGLTHDDYEVQITSFATQPFLDELGIAGGWQSVGQALWVEFDFRQELGAEVWRAGANG